MITKWLPDFKIEDTDHPQVLIYHTHTTESFEPYVREFYDAGFNYRTTDETKNVVMVGNEIEKQLKAAGIGVIHATVIHDYPSYNGSYDRSRETVTKILERRVPFSHTLKSKTEFFTVLLFHIKSHTD